MSLVAALVLSLGAVAADERPVQPIDFTKVPRKLETQPAYRSPHPLYGLFLFGLHADIPVWVVLDQTDPADDIYDVLWLDRDADGRLGEDGERVAAESRNPNSTRFLIGTFAVPGTKDVHQGFELTRYPERVSFRMKWRGDKLTMGAYGPDGDSYGNFGPSREKAPIFVPGYDRPFTFERWFGSPMHPGQETDFKVFVGNRGDRTGAFCTVDDQFLPREEYPVATLVYTDTGGKEQRFQVKLTERC